MLFIKHMPSTQFGIYKLIYWYNEDFDIERTQPVGQEKEWELFDLQEDPLEIVNCYHEEKYADIVGQMIVILDKNMEEIGDELVHS